MAPDARQKDRVETQTMTATPSHDAVDATFASSTSPGSLP
jgi:hypothetical protein